jgi:ABC-type dipeptide/oligopeptide/nickel transport system permease subunit
MTARILCFAVGVLVGALGGYVRGKRVSAVLEDVWDWGSGVA